MERALHLTVTSAWLEIPPGIESPRLEHNAYDNQKT
jgi:hypothetical protein